MKSKFLNTCISYLMLFLALYVMACVIAAAIIAGILLMPLLVVTLFVLAIREIIIWKRKPKYAGRGSVVVFRQQEQAVVRHMPVYKSWKEAA